MKLPRVSLGKFAIHGAQFDVRHAADFDGLELRASIHVNDVDDPRDKQTVVQREVVHVAQWCALPEQARRDVIKRLMMAALEHELSEWLRVDGELVTEPHPELKIDRAAG